MNSGPIILVVEDDDSLRDAMCETLLLAGFAARGVESGKTALEVIATVPVSLVISDVQMDGMDGYQLLATIKEKHVGIPVVLVTAFGSVPQAVQAIQAGASDYLQKPFEASVLVALAGRHIMERTCEDTGVIAADELTLSVLTLASRVAVSEATVMITGDSGTGKEVFAHYIHRQSSRRDGPFVAINCAAIPETMLEAILFGYEKGAFTNAYRASAGKFEQANGGTLLLDEISEMDVGLQAKLLRVLQEKEVERLGGNKAIRLDVRVLATTNRDLRQQVDGGLFREDLFYRLNVFPLNLPALRERPRDVLPLARHFFQAFGGPDPLTISGEAEQLLVAHQWPGNVRELENVVHRALILKKGLVIGASDIQFEQTVRSHKLPPVGGGSPLAAETSVQDAPADSLGSDLRVLEHRLILEAISAENGNRASAAERLGISPRTLRYKLAKFRREGAGQTAGAPA